MYRYRAESFEWRHICLVEATTDVHLYMTDERDRQGKRFCISTQITTSRTWISDEAALQILKNQKELSFLASVMLITLKSARLRT